jgi:hypothetical protein
MTGPASANPEPYSAKICCKATAERYSQFRPQYPQQVYDIILQHLGPEQRELAVDVATGSGQAAVQLAAFFKEVCYHASMVPHVQGGCSSSMHLLTYVQRQLCRTLCSHARLLLNFNSRKARGRSAGQSWHAYAARCAAFRSPEA